MFAGANGRFVAHNLFLDGTIFKDSRKADKENLVADFIAGINLVFAKQYRLTYTQVYRTPEYKTQNGLENYGSVTLFVSF